MIPCRTVPLVLVGLLATAAMTQERVKIYSPSRTTQQLVCIDADRSESKQELVIDRRVDLGFPCASICAHPSKPILYTAALRGAGKIAAAAIHLNASGDVEDHNRFELHYGSAYLSVDRSGQYLLSADYFGGHVDVYRLTENGGIGPRVTALDESRKNAHCVLPSPDNRFIYIPYVKDTNALYQYRFDAADGSIRALSPKNVGPPAGTGPRHMAYHPSLKTVYFSNEQHLGVSVYDMQRSGELKLKQVCDAVEKGFDTEGVSSSDIVITPDGRFIFAGIRGHTKDFDWISRYSVLEDGQLKLLGLSPIGKIPWGLTLSPDGKTLYATAFKGATLHAFSITGDGDLELVGKIQVDPSMSDLVAREIPQ